MVHDGHLRWEIVIVVLILILGVTVWGIADNSARISELRGKETAMQLAYTRKEAEYNDLQKQIGALESDAYTVARARAEYGMIMEGETRFVVANPEALEGYTMDEYQIILDDLRMKEQ